MEDPKMNGHLDKVLRVNRILQAGVLMDLPVPLVQTFLTAARHEGKTVNELVELTNANRSTVSRHLLDLSENLRNGDPGYGLLNRVRNPNDLRSVVFVLSGKGKTVMAQLRDVMEA